MNARKFLLNGLETQIIILIVGVGSYPCFIDWANNGCRLDDTKLFDLLLFNGVILFAFVAGFTLCKSRYSSRTDEYSVSEWIVVSALSYTVGFVGIPVYNVCEKIYKILEGLGRPVIESMFS